MGNLGDNFKGATGNPMMIPVQATAPDLSKMNPNAVVQTFLEKVDRYADKPTPPKPYKQLNDPSLVCTGPVPNEVTIKDHRGQNAYMKPMVPDVVKFANDPDAKDKEGQAKIGSAIKRDDVAYLQFTSKFAGTAEDITAYMKDVLKTEPIDVHQRGTGQRDGSAQTTILMDRKAMEKFMADNAAAIQAAEKSLTAASRVPAYSYGECGPGGSGK